MVQAWFYLLLAYWELVANGRLWASWWMLFPLLLAMGILLRKTPFLYLLRVFVWFLALMLVVMVITPLSGSHVPQFQLLDMELRGQHKSRLVLLLALVLWQGWVAYSAVVRCYFMRLPYVAR